MGKQWRQRGWRYEHPPRTRLSERFRVGDQVLVRVVHSWGTKKRIKPNRTLPKHAGVVTYELRTLLRRRGNWWGTRNGSVMTTDILKVVWRGSPEVGVDRFGGTYVMPR